MQLSTSSFWVAMLSVLLLACSGDSETRRGGNGPGGGGVPTAGNGTGGGSGIGGDGTAGTGGGLLPTGGMMGSPNDCGGETYQGEVKGKLDMFIVFDLSGSMFGVGVPGGWMMGQPTYFETVSPALKDFMNDPQSAGIGVALRSFSSVTCDVNALATPEIPMADLPGNAAPIAAWLDQQWANYMPGMYGPSMNYMQTDTYPAMEGAIQHQEQWAASHPSSKVVILLVTDGEPTDNCDDKDDVPEVAAMGLNKNIPTYVLGLGNVASLNSVAAAGGTGQAFVVSSAGAITDILTKLNQIRGDAQPLPCEFLVPDSGKHTPDEINLDYTAMGATDPETFPRVDSAAACGTLHAWHYDNPAAPSTLVACPSACSLFTTGGGQVSIAVGCPTIVPD